MTALPPAAQELVDLAESRELKVTIDRATTNGELVSVAVHITDGQDSWSAAWMRVGKGWRFYHGTDGWGDMSLSAIHSFVAAADPQDLTCIGREGTGGCRFAPVVIIGGDRACSYHVATVTHMRLREIQGNSVTVSVIGDGPWAK